ncbi:MAG: arginine:ornithine antiporter, partial [Duncaniella sp.]|nr:arginine:ornithine antiporter [Duncaniella sp.]
TYILKEILGDWAYWGVISALIISLLGGWVSWTLIVSQVPYEAALVKILPPAFSRVNRQGMPTFGLIASSIVMELFLLIVVTADDVYITALNITGLMIIPCYLFTGLFMLKVADTVRSRLIALVTALFCLWMAYAGGLREMFMTSVFYLAGIGFFISARRAYYPAQKPLFTRGETITLVILTLASLLTVYLLATA